MSNMSKTALKEKIGKAKDYYRKIQYAKTPEEVNIYKTKVLELLDEVLPEIRKRIKMM